VLLSHVTGIRSIVITCYKHQKCCLLVTCDYNASDTCYMWLQRFWYLLHVTTALLILVTCDNNAFDANTRTYVIRCQLQVPMSICKQCWLLSNVIQSYQHGYQMRLLHVTTTLLMLVTCDYNAFDACYMWLQRFWYLLHVIITLLIVVVTCNKYQKHCCHM
jgi:short subunit fatty acids transporter